MRPSQVIYDSAYMIGADSKSDRQGTHRVPTVVKLSYCQNITFGKSGHAVAGTLIAMSFIIHIVHIVLVGSQKQMRRIATQAIVAMVAYLHFWWNWAVYQFPCCAMREPLPVLKLKFAIPVAPGGLYERPTFFRALFTDFGKQSFFECSCPSRHERDGIVTV